MPARSARNPWIHVRVGSGGGSRFTASVTVIANPAKKVKRPKENHPFERSVEAPGTEPTFVATVEALLLLP